MHIIHFPDGQAPAPIAKITKMLHALAPAEK